MSGSPAPVTSLITSTAWSSPITPGRTPSTPAAPQEGASSAGGGVGWREREAGALVGVEDRQLPLEPEDRGGDDGNLEPHARVVEQVARREVVEAVDDHVVAL